MAIVYELRTKGLGCSISTIIYSSIQVEIWFKKEEFSSNLV